MAYTRNIAGDLIWDADTGKYIPAESFSNVIAIRSTAFYTNGHVNNNIEEVNFNDIPFVSNSMANVFASYDSGTSHLF